MRENRPCVSTGWAARCRYSGRRRQSMSLEMVPTPSSDSQRRASPLAQRRVKSYELPGGEPPDYDRHRITQFIRQPFPTKPTPRFWPPGQCRDHTGGLQTEPRRLVARLRSRSNRHDHHKTRNETEMLVARPRAWCVDVDTCAVPDQAERRRAAPVSVRDLGGRRRQPRPLLTPP